MPPSTSPRSYSAHRRRSGHSPRRHSSEASSASGSSSSTTSNQYSDHTATSYSPALMSQTVVAMPQPQMRPYPQPHPYSQSQAQSQPSRSYSTPVITAPPPHVLPQHPPSPLRPLDRIGTMPQPQPQPPPPPVRRETMADLADITDITQLRGRYRTIYPASIHGIHTPMPQLPPGQVSLGLTKTSPAEGVTLPPFKKILDPDDEPPAPLIPVTRTIHWWGGPEEAAPRIRPGGSASSSSAATARRSTSASTGQRRHRFGDIRPEGSESPSDHPFANLSLSGPPTPDREKASLEWQKSSRRLLNPKSVWSPPTPPSVPLPGLPEESESTDTIVPPPILPQTPAMLLVADGDSEEDLARLRERKNPDGFRFPDTSSMSIPMSATDSQQTIASSTGTDFTSPLVTPSNSKGQGDTGPILVSQSFDPTRHAVIMEEGVSYPKMSVVFAAKRPREDDEEDELEAERRWDGSPSATTMARRDSDKK